MDPLQPATPGPEILPPEPVAEPRRTRSRWAYAPATYVLLAINCLVFAVMLFKGVSATYPSADDLLHWGANNGDLVLNHGEWWRIVSATFVHIGFIHLATNMWCLWNLGLLGEPLLGPFGMLAAYLLSGAAGNLLSTLMHPQVVGAGASGAVFGLAGVLIVLLKSPRLPVPAADLRGLRRSVIWFALLNFLIGGSTSLFHTSVQIDNMAHLGGFLCGLLLGVPMVPRIGVERSFFLRRRRIAIAMVVTLLTLFAYYLSRIP